MSIVTELYTKEELKLIRLHFAYDKHTNTKAVVVDSTCFEYCSCGLYMVRSHDNLEIGYGWMYGCKNKPEDFTDKMFADYNRQFAAREDIKSYDNFVAAFMNAKGGKKII